MSKTTISLNGTWQMGWCPIGQGAPDTFSGLKQLPYTVPGDVHTPLMEAGLMEEPLYGLNSLDCRWVEDHEFWCERRFPLAAEDIREVMNLTFHGLDLTADVYLNGQYIGRHNNAFVEIAWPVQEYLHAGENTLLVRIDQGLADAQTHELGRMDMMWNNDQPWRSWMRKPQYVYSWDWTIWLASLGIWRDVTLTGYDQAALVDVYARPTGEALTEGQPATVTVTAETAMHSPIPCQLVCTIADREGQIVAQATQPVTGSETTLHLTIPAARLWWCNGMGEAYLYNLSVQLQTADGSPLDSHTQKLGLRTIALEEPVFENGESGFTFVLNGEPVFCKGANHVPCDCLPGRITPEKERQLVSMARDEHMNMLRIWGGGVYASEALMEACDEAGIMIWHDFLYACGYHPDHDPGFVENITDEAIKGIRRLRRHTSLIGWSGNNEVQEMYLSQRSWNPDLPWYGGTIYEKILPELVARMCPTLIYRQSSPFGGEYQADCRHGDQHIWVLTHVDSHPHYLDMWRFTEFGVKFLSEFGLMGAMTMETAQSCISAENMRPDDPVWVHHTNSCQNHTLLGRMMKQYFGDGQYSPQQYILRSQAIQAEITRHMYEEFRRQKFVCSGLLFWTLSDSYGVHNWSLIDYGLRRKPIYHALKQAMAPLALCVTGWDVQTNEGRQNWREHWASEPGKLALWGMNDTLTQQEAQLEWAVITTDGRILRQGQQAAVLPANQSVYLGDADLEGLTFEPEKTVFRARLLAEGEIINETKYFFAPFDQMIPSGAQVQCECTPIGEDRWQVTLTTDRFIWMLHVAEPDGTTCSENDFELWPGERKTLTITTKQKDFTPVLHWMGKEA